MLLLGSILLTHFKIIIQFIQKLCFKTFYLNFIPKYLYSIFKHPIFVQVNIKK